MQAQVTVPAHKSFSAYRTIGEVAKLLNLEVHVLRYWETKFPQVSPIKRRGNRRYYRPEDIALLTQIKDLLYQQGYSIKGAQSALTGTGSTMTTGQSDRALMIETLAKLKQLRASLSIA